MGVIFKCAASAVLCAAVCLLIKRSNPEIAFLLGTATAAVLLYMSLTALSQMAQTTIATVKLPENTLGCIEPTVKCLGVALTTKYTGSLCRDASQSSLACAIETAGTVCAAIIALPSLVSVLKIVGELL